MINKPSPFKGHNIRIPSTIPIRRRGFINKGSTSGLGLNCLGVQSCAAVWSATEGLQP